MDALVLGRFDCTALAYVWRYLATTPGGTKAQTAEAGERAFHALSSSLSQLSAFSLTLPGLFLSAYVGAFFIGGEAR